MRLFGAAEALRDRIGVKVPDVVLARHEAAVAQLRTELDEDEFKACWNQGRALGTDEAVAEGLTLDAVADLVPVETGIHATGS